MRERRPTFYILVDRVPVAVEGVLEMVRWRAAYEGKDVMRVAFSDFPGVEVSTVFLGIDHNHWGEGPPLLFETMIFGGEHDGWLERCSTWEEAEAMHARAVVKVQPLRLVN